MNDRSVASTIQGDTSEPESRRQLPVLDALRAIAALAVFVFHASVLAGFDKRTLPTFRILGHTFARVPSPLGLGSTGVHLFFLVSGFCLALQQWRRGRRTFTCMSHLREYAWGRLARIVPSYWVTILVSLVVAAALLPPTAIEFEKGLSYHTLMHALFLHGFDPDTWLSLHGGLWSMVTEVQFYLLFPLMLALYARVGGLRFVVLLTVANLVFRLLLAHPWMSSSAWVPVLAYQLPGRIAEFAFGIALCDLYLRATPLNKWVTRFSIALVPLVVIAISVRAAGPAFAADLPFGFMYFALCGVLLLKRQVEQKDSPLADRALSMAARFGRCSYSFFLVHFPIMLVLYRKCTIDEAHQWARFFYFIAAAAPLSVVSAWVLNRGVEIPMWRLLTRKGVDPLALQVGG